MCLIATQIFIPSLAKGQATVGRLSAYRAKWEDYVLRFENARYHPAIPGGLPQRGWQEKVAAKAQDSKNRPPALWRLNNRTRGTRAGFRWLCANPCFTWRCIITIIVRFTVLQFFGRRGWETDGQPGFPRPGRERQKVPRRERKPAISASKGRTFSLRVFYSYALLPLAQRSRCACSRCSVLGHQKFGAPQEEILILALEKYYWILNEGVITPNGIYLHVMLLCIFFAWLHLVVYNSQIDEIQNKKELWRFIHYIFCVTTSCSSQFANWQYTD